MANRTRIVRLLRVALPLLALALLSSLFLLGRRPDGRVDIPYADVTEAPGRPALEAPSYAGVADDGAAITLQADDAGPAGAAQGASALRLTWRRPDTGQAADLTAPRAEVADGQVMLSGGVRITTSDGWALTTPDVQAATDRSRFVAPQMVEGFAPLGQVTAGAMEMTPGDQGKMMFTGGVRLIYQP